VILVDGQVAGTWRANRKGRRVNITVEPFAALSPDVEAGVAAKVAAIGEFVASSAGPSMVK
jgi:hypothetical protein